jgi:hypothetical protein
MLARKVVTRSGRKIRGYFPSQKMDRMVQWESLLERDAILLMEFSRGVRQYREQPELIQYQHGDSTRRYFPDFEITGSSGEFIYLEIKSEQQLCRPDIADKLRHVALHYERQGRRYHILTERTIRRQPLLDNLKLLMRSRRANDTIQAVRADVFRSLAKQGYSFTEMADRIGNDVLITLIALGEVGCNLEAPLDATNRLLHPEEIDHDQVLL